MRRGFLFLAPVVLGLAAFAPAAGNTLSVDEVGCNNNGGGNFGCYTIASGGTGVYTSYTWTATEKRFGWPDWVRWWTTSEPYLYDTCTIGSQLHVSVRVTDSQGSTASANTSINCTGAAD